jgi:hypothetical protein
MNDTLRKYVAGNTGSLNDLEGQYCATSPRSASRVPISTRPRTHPTRTLPLSCGDTRSSFDPVHPEQTRERMRKDVRRFIRRLEAVGLSVEPTPGGTTASCAMASRCNFGFTCALAVPGSRVAKLVNVTPSAGRTAECADQRPSLSGSSPASWAEPGIVRTVLVAATTLNASAVPL